MNKDREPYPGYKECCERWAKVRALLPVFDREKYEKEKQEADERHEICMLTLLANKHGFRLVKKEETSSGEALIKLAKEHGVKSLHF